MSNDRFNGTTPDERVEAGGESRFDGTEKSGVSPENPKLRRYREKVDYLIKLSEDIQALIGEEFLKEQILDLRGNITRLESGKGNSTRLERKINTGFTFIEERFDEVVKSVLSEEKITVSRRVSSPTATTVEKRKGRGIIDTITGGGLTSSTDTTTILAPINTTIDEDSEVIESEYSILGKLEIYRAYLLIKGEAKSTVGESVLTFMESIRNQAVRVGDGVTPALSEVQAILTDYQASGYKLRDISPEGKSQLAAIKRQARKDESELKSEFGDAEVGSTIVEAMESRGESRSEMNTVINADFQELLELTKKKYGNENRYEYQSANIDIKEEFDRFKNNTPEGEFRDFLDANQDAIIESINGGEEIFRALQDDLKMWTEFVEENKEYLSVEDIEYIEGTMKDITTYMIFINSFNVSTIFENIWAKWKKYSVPGNIGEFLFDYSLFWGAIIAAAPVGIVIKRYSSQIRKRYQFNQIIKGLGETSGNTSTSGTGSSTSSTATPDSTDTATADSTNTANSNNPGATSNNTNTLVGTVRSYRYGAVAGEKLEDIIRVLSANEEAFDFETQLQNAQQLKKVVDIYERLGRKDVAKKLRGLKNNALWSTRNVFCSEVLKIRHGHKHGWKKTAWKYGRMPIDMKVSESITDIAGIRVREYGMNNAVDILDEFVKRYEIIGTQAALIGNYENTFFSGQQDEFRDTMKEISGEMFEESYAQARHIVDSVYDSSFETVEDHKLRADLIKSVKKLIDKNAFFKKWRIRRIVGKYGTISDADRISIESELDLTLAQKLKATLVGFHREQMSELGRMGTDNLSGRRGGGWILRRAGIINEIFDDTSKIKALLKGGSTRFEEIQNEIRSTSSQEIDKDLVRKHIIDEINMRHGTDLEVPEDGELDSLRRESKDIDKEKIGDKKADIRKKLKKLDGYTIEVGGSPVIISSQIVIDDIIDMGTLEKLDKVLGDLIKISDIAKVGLPSDIKTETSRVVREILTDLRNLVTSEKDVKVDPRIQELLGNPNATDDAGKIGELVKAKEIILTYREFPEDIREMLRNRIKEGIGITDIEDNKIDVLYKYRNTIADALGYDDLTSFVRDAIKDPEIKFSKLKQLQAYFTKISTLKDIPEVRNPDGTLQKPGKTYDEQVAHEKNKLLGRVGDIGGTGEGDASTARPDPVSTAVEGDASTARPDPVSTAAEGDDGLKPGRELLKPNTNWGRGYEALRIQVELDPEITINFDTFFNDVLGGNYVGRKELFIAMNKHLTSKGVSLQIEEISTKDFLELQRLYAEDIYTRHVISSGEGTNQAMLRAFQNSTSPIQTVKDMGIPIGEVPTWGKVKTGRLNSDTIDSLAIIKKGAWKQEGLVNWRKFLASVRGGAS